MRSTKSNADIRNTGDFLYEVCSMIVSLQGKWPRIRWGGGFRENLHAYSPQHSSSVRSKRDALVAMR